MSQMFSVRFLPLVPDRKLYRHRIRLIGFHLVRDKYDSTILRSPSCYYYGIMDEKKQEDGYTTWHAVDIYCIYLAHDYPITSAHIGHVDLPEKYTFEVNYEFGICPSSNYFYTFIHVEGGSQFCLLQIKRSALETKCFPLKNSFLSNSSIMEESIDFEYKIDLISDLEGIIRVDWFEPVPDQVDLPHSRILNRTNLFHFSIQMEKNAAVIKEIILPPLPTKFSDILANKNEDECVIWLDWRVRLLFSTKPETSVDKKELLAFYNVDMHNQVYLLRHQTTTLNYAHCEWEELKVNTTMNELEISVFGHQPAVCCYDDGFFMKDFFMKDSGNVYQAEIDIEKSEFFYKRIGHGGLFHVDATGTVGGVLYWPYEACYRVKHKLGWEFIYLKSPQPLKYLAFWQLQKHLKADSAEYSVLTLKNVQKAPEQSEIIEILKAMI